MHSKYIIPATGMILFIIFFVFGMFMPFTPPNFVPMNETINIYSAPNQDSHLNSTAYIGNTLLPIAKYGKDWLEVVDSTTGNRGWIYSKDVHAIAEKLAKEKQAQQGK